MADLTQQEKSQRKEEQKYNKGTVFFQLPKLSRFSLHAENTWLIRRQALQERPQSLEMFFFFLAVTPQECTEENVYLCMCV